MLRRRLQAAFTLARSLHSDSRGTIAIKFAVALPVLLAATGAAVDYALVLRQKTTLQTAADAASLAAARELSLSDANRENVDAVVKSVLNSQLRANENRKHSSEFATVTATVSGDPLEVDVTATQPATSAFGFHTGFVPSHIKVRSVARVIGQPNICVLALASDGGADAILLKQAARMTGQDCAVFSNSTDPEGIVVQNNAMLKAQFICSAGGSHGGVGQLDPLPLTDCPTFEDPLAARPAPTIGPCEFEKLQITDETRTLSPGTYCGGLQITGTSRVTFEPGVYVIKDGAFIVDDTAAVEGQGTGFYLAGDSARIDFRQYTSIRFSAPTSGDMAGILFFSARDQPKDVVNRIRSDDARLLLGTLYFPSSKLLVDAEKPVGDQSAYTAIVANRLSLLAGPHLVLNTNYAQTDVPVPKGIKGAGQPAALVR